MVANSADLAQLSRDSAQDKLPLQIAVVRDSK
jgi:hypothetical protein